MGLFTSTCPKCKADIHWFLEAPKNYVCKCGKAVSATEIEESWAHNYKQHIANLIVKNGVQNCSAATIGKQFTLGEAFVQDVLDNYINKQ